MTDIPPKDALPQTQASPSADLRINEVHVSNFRNIVDVRIPLESGATFLVGENNAGKSSFLVAIAAACGSHRVTRDDLRQSDEGTSTEATVDLIIRSAGVEFTEAVAQRLSGNYGNGPGPGEWTAIRTRLVESRESSFLSTRRSYLSWDASTQTWIGTTRAPSSQVLELLAAHLVDASRDLSVDVLSRTSDWGRVLADLGVSEADRKSLETSLSDLGRLLQDASPTFGKLASELEEDRPMKSSRYTPEQVAFALRQAEGGTPVLELCRKMGISEQTLYRWKKKFQGMGVVEVRRLRVLEEENRKLKQLVADLSLDKQMLQDVLRTSPEACSTEAPGRVSPDSLLRK